MSDKFVPVAATPNFDPRVSIKPYYLLVTAAPNAKQLSYYLCPKLDRHASFVDVHGQELTTSQVDEVQKPGSAQNVLKKEDLRELTFPWERVVKIVNLTFRAK